MGANIPSIGNIGDIDLSEAKSKVSSGASGLALSAISIFSGDDKKKTIMSQLNKAEKSGKQAKSKISETNGKLDKARKEKQKLKKPVPNSNNNKLMAWT